MSERDNLMSPLRKPYNLFCSIKAVSNGLDETFTTTHSSSEIYVFKVNIFLQLLQLQKWQLNESFQLTPQLILPYKSSISWPWWNMHDNIFIFWNRGAAEILFLIMKSAKTLIMTIFDLNVSNNEEFHIKFIIYKLLEIRNWAAHEILKVFMAASGKCSQF